MCVEMSFKTALCLQVYLPWTAEGEAVIEDMSLCLRLSTLGQAGDLVRKHLWRLALVGRHLMRAFLAKDEIVGEIVMRWFAQLIIQVR